MEDIVQKSTREIYRNPWMRLREDEIERRDGSAGIYGVVEKVDFAVIAAIQDGLVHMVEQYRYPVKARYWELPQGALRDDGGATPEEVAATELEEEAGVIAAHMERIGFLHACYGFSDHGYHVFLATGLTVGPPKREAEEVDMISRAMPLDDVLGMIRDGTITDAHTVATLSLLQLHGKI